MKKYSYEYINTLAFIYAVSYEKEKRKQIQMQKWQQTKTKKIQRSHNHDVLSSVTFNLVAPLSYENLLNSFDHQTFPSQPSQCHKNWKELKVIKKQKIN